MAKRKDLTTQSAGATTPLAAGGNSPNAPDMMEERLVAFAEQLGRFVGTVQAKAEGWMDREALGEQIAGVRDAASDLLGHLTTAAQAARRAASAGASRSTSTPKRPENRGRSGGVVDAPGKKHRKPAPRDPRANLAKNQSAKMRSSRTMVAASRRRGRG